MCIIAYKPKGISVARHVLETCFVNNPDGAGFMFPCEGKLLIRKGYFEFGHFLTAWDKCRKIHGDGLPVVFHFRIATAGEIDKTNCHPHRVARDLGFVHNGILSCVTVPKDSDVSDTIIYRDRYLGNLSSKNLHNDKLLDMIGQHIGAGNKFVFMSGEGKVAICNEKQGVWKDGLWFSNYSFLPRRGNPFSILSAAWFCEYCGVLLETVDEENEGICRECLDYFESESVGCGGCYGALTSRVHRELGWCDDCGYDIYGRRWKDMLHHAAEQRDWDVAHDCF